MNAITVFLLYTVGLLGSIVVVRGILIHLILTLADRRGPRCFRVPIGMICGYVGGALFIWSLVPRSWTLPLTTIEAALNAEKYGYAVEHYAEMTLLWLLFGAVLGAAIGGSGAAIVPRLVKPRGLAYTTKTPEQ